VRSFIEIETDLFDNNVRFDNRVPLWFIWSICSGN